LVKDEHGIIYAGIGGDAGYAFNSDGSIRWFRAFSNDPSSPRQLIQVEQNVLYAERNQTISALSTQDGQQIWSKTTSSGGFIGGISVANGVVYVTSYVLASDPQAESTSYVEAYRATDGALVWQSRPLNQSLFAAPVVANGLVYVGSPNSQVYALNVENGQVKWHQNAGHSVFAPPYISDRILVIGTSGVDDAHIIAYNAVTGTQKWSHPSFSFDGPSNEHMFVSANRVYYGFNGSIHVLNLANGQQIAAFTAGSGTDTRFTVVE
ncbi:MAG TPA: PQQ-binding-like beta-propeller repeat protein, partial [Ktedonobacteraceae bacterium]|nr:PQQ-binding-like beta-propeller repeat protein [Ktedonobacteraceae bacterium]